TVGDVVRQARWLGTAWAPREPVPPEHRRAAPLARVPRTSSASARRPPAGVERILPPEGPLRGLRGPRGVARLPQLQASNRRAPGDATPRVAPRHRVREAGD